MVVEDIVAYGDKAAVRWSATGTFTGDGKFQGLTADRRLASRSRASTC